MYIVNKDSKKQSTYVYNAGTGMLWGQQGPLALTGSQLIQQIVSSGGQRWASSMQTPPDCSILEWSCPAEVASLHGLFPVLALLLGLQFKSLSSGSQLARNICRQQLPDLLHCLPDKPSSPVPESGSKTSFWSLWLKDFQVGLQGLEFSMSYLFGAKTETQKFAKSKIWRFWFIITARSRTYILANHIILLSTS